MSEVEDVILEQGSYAVVQMPLMQALGVEAFQDLGYGLLADIHHEVLVFVKQVAPELDVQPVGLSHVEEILGVVAI